jgi:Tfp pilus assembly protein PilN
MAAVVAGVGAVVALLFFVFVLQSARLSNAEQKLQAQEAVNADLQGKIGQLQQFQQLKLTVAAREALAASALSGQVAWSGVLRDISMVIPNKMWLTGMNGTLTSGTTAPLAPSGTPTNTAAPAPVAPTLVGTIQFQGMASDFPTVGRWLQRLEQVNGWVNSWATNALRQSSDAASTQINADKVQFTASVDLTTEATVQGSRK